MLEDQVLSKETIECVTPPGSGTQLVSVKVNGKFSTDNETLYEYVEPQISMFILL